LDEREGTRIKREKEGKRREDIMGERKGKGKGTCAVREERINNGRRKGSRMKKWNR